MKTHIKNLFLVPALIAGLGSLLAWLLTFGSAAQAAILINGSFDAGTNVNDATGWTDNGIGGQIVGYCTCEGISDGVVGVARELAFNGGNSPPIGIAYQTFTTFAGQKYFAEFDFQKHAGGAGTASVLSEVLDGGSVTIGSTTASASIGGDVGRLQNFVTYDFSFTANGTSSTLRFTDTSSGTVSFDVNVDRASINVIRNGSFELGGGTTGGGLTGWTLTGNAATSSEEGQSNGLDALALNGGDSTPNAVVYQDFQTLVGMVYTVDFDLSKFGTAVGTAQLLAEVLDANDLGSGDLASLTASDSTGDTHTNDGVSTNFTHLTFSFAAVSTLTRLQFTDTSLGTAGFNAVLDNVDVNIIGVPVNAPPVARCKNVTVSAGCGISANASINDGSSDPDGDTLTIVQTPAGPYPLGETTVTLTVTDPSGASDTCTSIVTVVQDLFAADGIVWHQPLARNGASEDTDPGAGGTLKYRFKLGSTIPIKVHAQGCSADVTANANVSGRVTVFGDTDCDGVVDAGELPIDYNGVGEAGGVMDKIDGHLKYNLDTKKLPQTVKCYILQVTITDSSTGESRTESVPLQAK